ncbi:MAG: Serine/threonine protein kinase [Labilithrix sp.]|nr:Serine/threonine protein kinase [Labilithrix sp.]
MQGGRVGRYVLGPEIASGGMASVHLGRMLGRGGFGKTVAMKRLHAQYGRDPEFVTLFQDEARVTSALTHANIVMTLDVLEENDELYIVMEYVHGASLSQILGRKPGQMPIPLRISVGIIAAMLDGLHAAHEATDGNGEPLDIIHRDVSPQNVLVSFQGVAKIADFGIAKAAGRVHSTGNGSVKGKIAYMAPEQLLAMPVTARTDIYATGILLWEAITGRRLIDFNSTAENLRAALELEIDAPSKSGIDVPPELDEVVMRAVERLPAGRFDSAKEMGTALRKATDVAHSGEIGDWLRAERSHLLAMREKSLAHLQRTIGALGGMAVGLGTPPSQTSDPNIAVEAETLNGPSSNPSSSSAGAPRSSRARRFFPAMASLIGLGIAGANLAMIATRPSSATPPSSSGASTSISSSAPSSAPSDERVAAMMTVASSAPATTAMDDPPSPPSPSSSTAATSSSRKPGSMGAPAASSSRKCRIVPSTDSVGHTKFTEVCP